MLEHPKPPPPLTENPLSAEATDRPKVRRFPIEPIEVSTRSSHDGKTRTLLQESNEKKALPSSTSRKYLPIPILTTFHSNRPRKDDKTSATSSRSKLATLSKGKISPSKTKPPRKFVPDLIETNRRSKKFGDPKPAILPTDKTDLTPGVPNIYTTSQIPRERETLNVPYELDVKKHSIRQLPHKPRRQRSVRPHNNTRCPSRISTRQSSFTSVLESISSSGSCSPTSPSKSQSYQQSLSAQNVASENAFQLSRTRESCDERFSGYILALAAKTARKQLMEKALLLAAYPNESDHQNVEHFYDREVETASENDSPGIVGNLNTEMDDDTSDGSNKFRERFIRRRSSDSLYAIREMQVHKDRQVNLRKEQAAKTRLGMDGASSNHGPFRGRIKKSHASLNKDAVEKELQNMQSAASPPMLGTGLKFRRCSSPSPMKFEIDQKSDLKFNRSNTGGGLWGGYCVADDSKDKVTQDEGKRSPLIHTPWSGKSFGHALEESLAEQSLYLVDSNSRTSNNDNIFGAHHKIIKQQESKVSVLIESEKYYEEFDDKFVTQVYNYLSLGYPSLAWQFDEELSRISKIPVDELRRNDEFDIKGHIGLRAMSFREDETTAQTEKIESQDKDKSQSCTRWRALKLYVQEWSRQNPSLDQAALGPCSWGVRARKGSWAF
ncbi:hypothetical protein OnM2_087015 [Erysiphe neolycopersici]|uniref:Uncharacterized protein n=1 Tax=Erysiphe neolycopersici TaxID=212602 RepID=A0A420HE26_9PEZI|nr:hypothetical protein OnM2_087015 [Erysiphe neolycopersici]